MSRIRSIGIIIRNSRELRGESLTARQTYCISLALASLQRYDIFMIQRALHKGAPILLIENRVHSYICRRRSELRRGLGEVFTTRGETNQYWSVNEPLLVTNMNQYWSRCEPLLVGALTSSGWFGPLRGGDSPVAKSRSLVGTRRRSYTSRRADLFVTLCTIHSFMVGSARVFLSFIRCKT